MAQNLSSAIQTPKPHCLGNRHYVTIIKVIDPVRFIVRETPGPEMSKSASDFLKLEDQILSRADEFDIIPENYLIPAKGTLVLVKPTRGKIWCRGKVENILETSRGVNINVYLLDYGKTDTVSPKAIRIPDDKVFKVPFQAFEFVLFALKPLSLQFDVDIKVKRMQAKKWDIAALDFVNQFLSGSSTAQIQVTLLDEKGRFHGNMFSTEDDEICLNDVLVDRSFAWFDEELRHPEEKLECGNRNFEPGETSQLVTEWLSNIPKSGESAHSAPKESVQSEKVHSTPNFNERISPRQSIGRGKLLNKLSKLSLESSSNENSGEENTKAPAESPKNRISMESKTKKSMPDTTEVGNVTSREKAVSSSQNEPPCLKVPLGSPYQKSLFIVPNPGFGRGGVLQYFAPVKMATNDINSTNDVDDQEPINLSKNDINPSCEQASQRSNSVASDKETRPSSRCSSSSSSRVFPMKLFIELSKKAEKANQKSESTPELAEMNDSPNSLRIDKYPKLKQKCDKDTQNSKISGNNLNQSILKPLPPNFIHRVSSDSFVSGDPKTKNMDISKEIEQSGVQSFFRKNKELSADNTYNTEASLDSTMEYISHMDYIGERATPEANVICHGTNIPKPIMKIEEIMFEHPIVRALKNEDIKIPTILQSHLWPAVLRGRSCVCVGLKNSGKSLGYIIPILNQLQQIENYADLPDGPGPLVIVLCTNWMSCQNVQEQFETFGSFRQRNYLTTLHGGDKIQDKMVDLLRGCNILITTPSMLLKVMNNDTGFDMDRCCHLILEEADHVIEIFVKDLLEIMREFRKAIVRRGKEATTANQIIVCATSWSRGVKSFSKMMPNPLFYFSNFLEAAIHAEIPFHVQITDLHREHTAIFDILQRAATCNTVICATDCKKVQSLGKLLKLNSYECLIAHEEMVIYEMENIKYQWNTSACSSNNPIIIVSDAILHLLNITNAECLIHYDLPDLSKLQFSNRFSCLRDVLKARGSVVDDVETMSKNTSLKECVSHVIINGTHAHQCYELRRIMVKLKCQIPPKLAFLAKKELLTRELCENLLAFGECEVKEFCRLRHKFFTEIDQPPTRFPHFGEIKIFVKYVVNAGLFYANILSYRDSETGEIVKQCRDEYTHLDLELQDYYQNGKIKEIVSNPVVGELCAMRGIGGPFYRVKIMKVYPVKRGLVQKLEVFSIDFGWTRTVEANSVFVLKNNLASLPPQAVKFRICKVKPIDGSNMWTVQANTFVHDALTDSPLIGIVVMSLRDCIFVTNLGRRRSENNPDDILLDTTVVSKLKSRNLAIANPKHIELLEKLCNGVISWKKGHIEPRNETPLSALVTEESFEINSPNEVFVTTVRSPSLFYAVLTRNYEKLLELNEYINKLYHEDKLIKAGMVKKNSIVIGPFEAEQRWYRARVLEIQEEFVQLYFPDFGDDGIASIRDLYEMPRKILLTLPFQALECSLTGIKAAHGGWSELAIESFANLTREDDDESVYRKLILTPFQTSTALNSSGYLYTVALHFENEASVGLELVKKGLAEDTNSNLLISTAPERNESDDDSVCSEHLDKIERECENEFWQCIGVDQQFIDRSKGYYKYVENKYQNTPSDVVAACDKKYYPKTKWFQTEEHVVVHIELSGCSDYSAELAETFISFQTIRGNKFYDLHEELYQNIDAGASNAITLPERVKLTLQKCVTGQKWPRLTKSDENKPYLKLHVDHIDSDDEKLFIRDRVSTSDAKPLFIRHYDSDDNSSESQEEEWVKETEDQYNEEIPSGI